MRVLRLHSLGLVGKLFETFFELALFTERGNTSAPSRPSFQFLDWRGGHVLNPARNCFLEEIA